MTLDLNMALSNARKIVELSNSIRDLVYFEKKGTPMADYNNVWQIDSSYLDPENKLVSVKFNIAFPKDFPLVVPKIYLSKEAFEEIGFIPHVDGKAFICLYDEEDIILDANRPGDIVLQALEKAKEIIHDGVIGKNKGEFLEEIKAYWDISYSETDKVMNAYAHILPDMSRPTNSLKIVFLHPPFGTVTAIFHDRNPEYLSLQSYFKDTGHKLSEYPVFYLGQVDDLQPPFFNTNANIYSQVLNFDKETQDAFVAFINKNNKHQIVLFSMIIDDVEQFFGWEIRELEVIVNGRRSKSHTPMDIFTGEMRNKTATRLNITTLTRNRLVSRTDGILNEQSHNYIVAGLGSIGSNLLSSLLATDINRLWLIDPEVFQIENANRHLLSLKSAGKYKVEEVKSYVRDQFPTMEVNADTKSILEVVSNDLDTVNTYDFMFLVIGKTNIENYIVELVKEGTIKIPLFIMWVEPFLQGGHCIYLPTGHQLEYLNLFEGGLYRYNFIEKAEYDAKDRFLMKEAGCQTSYIPYGRKNISLFLGSILPHILNIIESKETRSLRMAWTDLNNTSINKRIIAKDVKANNSDNLEIEELKW